MKTDFDIAVIGGGLTGVASARLLSQRGFDVVHFAPQFEKDFRTSALMMPAVEFMQHQGLIDAPSSLGAPLRNIRIIDATSRLLRSPETLFQSREIALDAFGYNFANHDLLQQFNKLPSPAKQIDEKVIRVEKSDDAFTVKTEEQTFTARLVVAADGKNSLVRDQSGIEAKLRPHKQSALVADFELERVEAETSIEFHYENGPFTLVPAGDKKINLVWLDEHQTLFEAAQKSPRILADIVEEKSHHLFGKAEAVSKAFVFPLANLTVSTAGKDGVFLVGETAHAFPPIGAQGLNLGLRDVKDLLDATSELKPGFTAEQGVMASDQYAGLRQRDLLKTNGFVDGLYRSLVSDLLPAQALRQSGLWALKTVPPLRKFAMRFGLG